MCSVHLRLCFLLTALAGQYVQTERQTTIYEKILSESDYSTFNQLIRSNTVAIRNLRFSPLTVFVPENQAFDLYDGEIFADLAFYHMTFEVKNITMLKSSSRLASVHLENPPLWITKVNEDIYVNSAKVLQDKSDNVYRSRTGISGQQQVLHMIDQVLDPMIKSPKFPPLASHFLTSDDKWNLGGTTMVTKFHQRVRDNKLLHLFEEDEPRTFFIPIDSGIGVDMYKMIDKKVIQRHVISNHVLFTRPSERTVVKSATNDVPLSLSIEKREETWFVNYVEDDFEQFSAEILTPDIPLRNGVVHLISKPLSNFAKRLKPFPYLPIIEKITNDPEIDIFYKMGSLTKFNEKFEKENVNFTYFIPRDSSWIKTKNLGLEPVDTPNDILSRHLVISETPYSMQQLASMSKINGYNNLELNSEGGPLRITVHKEEENYFIKWNKKYIQVVRPDYECTNGIVHILSAPMVNFRKHDDNGEFYRNSQISSKSLVNYWDIVEKMVV